MAAQEIARIAEWGEEKIAQYKEKVTEEGRKRDIDRGKPRAQVRSLLCIHIHIHIQILISCFWIETKLCNCQAAFDEAGYLLNLASLEGTWDESLERVAQCYKEAGLNDIAKFVMYRD